MGFNWDTATDEQKLAEIRRRTKAEERVRDVSDKERSKYGLKKPPKSKERKMREAFED